MDTKINGFQNFSNIGGVNNETVQTKEQDTLKQSLSKTFVIYLYNLITECLQNRQGRVIIILISEPSRPNMYSIKYFVTLHILAVALKHAVCEKD